MLFSQIITDPARFQFRDKPYSEKTVAGILASGIDPSKFDPIPLIPGADGMYVVAGDGHSRFEACRRAAERFELPSEWRIADDEDDWQIPHRIVTPAQAKRLRLANLNRDPLTPAEESAAYQRLIDEGDTVDSIARASHRTAVHVNKMLTLNILCRDIRNAIGASADAAGIDVLTAQVLANGFTR